MVVPIVKMLMKRAPKAMSIRQFSFWSSEGILSGMSGLTAQVNLCLEYTFRLGARVPGWLSC